MTCVIFGDAFTFPEGDASTNRVYAYARGFRENGTDVHVVCFRNSYMDTPSGNTEGIKFYHPYNRMARSKSFFQRRFDEISKYFQTITLFREFRKQEDISFILCYTKAVKTQLFAFLISRFFGSRLILERSEHPLKDYGSKVGEVVFGFLKVFMEIWFTDYIFCISDYLIDFYRHRGARESRLFKVHSIVDNTRFRKSYDRPVKSKYICYAGSLTKLKDGVDILIHSFSRIAGKYPDISLVLVGKADTTEDEHYFRDLVTNLELNGRVVFTGKLPRNEIPAYLCNAEVLALARPRSMVADAGFPSKLTEYLAAGRPVVVTRVGEIPAYLTDNENAFLSEPDSAEAFAERLDYVLSSYQFAAEAGFMAKELTYTVFNNNYQAMRILAFLESNLKR
jgi:glycosyltransferase involved in cell wall biosynthesis